MNIDQNNTITNYFSDISKINSEFKSENIKESEIFRQLDIWCQGKPLFVKELLTEQVELAIKLFEDSTIRPLPDIHFYFPVENLDPLPDFLRTLLTKYKKSENNVFIFTNSENLDLIPFLEESGFCEQKIDEKCAYNSPIIIKEYFFNSFTKYAETMNNDKLKKMAPIMAMEIALSHKILLESNFFDSHLLEIDKQRMAEKKYPYHVFKTDISDVFHDKKFHDFVTSSSKEEKFNFICGDIHAIAVSVQKKDDKLSFVTIDSSDKIRAITIKELEIYNSLMPTSNSKIINLCVQTQADLEGCRIFSRDALVNLLKNEEDLNKLHDLGKYGEAVFYHVDSAKSVTDIVGPGVVRFSQISSVTDKYQKSFEKRDLLDKNVRKNKSNESQTWEQYRAAHSRDEEVLDKQTNKVVKKYRNKGIVDKREKLFMVNSDFLSDKLGIDNKTFRSFLAN